MTVDQEPGADGAEPVLIDAGSIDLDHAPTARDDLAFVELDGETVIYDSESGESHLLNPVATVIWRCFDGQGTIAEIAADLADAFDIDVDTAGEEVQLLAQTLGYKGLLVGVERFVRKAPQPPVELPEGSAIEPFTLPRFDAGEVTLADLEGQQSILINWSTGCGYCDRIVPDLVEAQPALAGRGAQVVLWSKGSVESHQKLLDQGVTGPIGIVGDGAPDLFPGVGTPAAYVVDETGAIASPLVVGAVEVPRLVRELAGLPEPGAVDHDHDHDHDDDHDDWDPLDEEDDDAPAGCP